MREPHFLRTGRLDWRPITPPADLAADAALVRPFIAGRCDGDTLPIHHPVSRALQAGIVTGLIDPVVADICGPVPFRGPFGIGHECVAEVVAVGTDVRAVEVGQTVIVPWAVSCGICPACRRGLTSKCTTTRAGRILAAYGFGPSCGPYGGMITDTLTVPYAEHMLVPVPDGVPPLRAAAASDNLADAWRTVVPALTAQPGASVLILGGGATVARAGFQVHFVEREPHVIAIGGALIADSETPTDVMTIDVAVMTQPGTGASEPPSSIASWRR